MAPSEGDCEKFSSHAGTQVLLEVFLALEGSWGGFTGEVLSGTLPRGEQLPDSSAR